MRLYWLRFSITSPTGQVAIGDCEWRRELPITCARDLKEITIALGQEMAKQGRAVVGSDISIIHWQAFEEPSILLPDRGSQGPERSLPPAIQ
jgi:hypothetical protein